MSIDYELAKELKDAGFPQTQFEVFCKHGCPPFNQHEESRQLQCGECHLADLVYFPTLEELIEACGGGLENLRRNRLALQQLRSRGRNPRLQMD